jgi:hypothetical protein
MKLILSLHRSGFDIVEATGLDLRLLPVIDNAEVGLGPFVLMPKLGWPFCVNAEVGLALQQ